MTNDVELANDTIPSDPAVPRTIEERAVAAIEALAVAMTRMAAAMENLNLRAIDAIEKQFHTVR